MESLENLGKPGRFGWASGVGVIALIILGFMGTTVSAFLSFTRWDDSNLAAAERASMPSSDALVCECTIQIQPTCDTNQSM